MTIQRPTWLPARIPELDGLRGLAVLGVFFYHCHPFLTGTPIHEASLWGWSGVTLFFVLSGFLITSILLESQGKPHYFRNFYGRRLLRIWPLYILALAIYSVQYILIGPDPATASVASVPWWAYALLIQNLLRLPMPPALGPTWSLAIEEQYYLLWAPIVRWLRRPWMLAIPLLAALIGSPLMRMQHGAWIHVWITPTHTLTHLDGIAMGSLIALAMHTLRIDRRVWLAIGCFAIGIGFSSAAGIAGGTAFLDSALTLGFGGAVIAALASTGSHSPLNAILRRGPLPFYGKISYGLYITHIFVFIYLGWFNDKLAAFGTPGNLSVVLMRGAASTLVATAIWYGFESKILRLKRFF